jgi:chromosome segregation ATPase
MLSAILTTFSRQINIRSYLMTTPIEQAQQRLAELEAAQSESARESHRLQSEIAAAKLAGDLALMAELQQQFGQVNQAHTVGRGRIVEAQEAVRAAQNELRAAKNRAKSLEGELGRTEQNYRDAHERSISLLGEIERLREQLAEIQQRLGKLEPAEQPQELAQTPAPTSRRDPDYIAPEQPARVVSYRGEPTRYYNRAGQEIDQNGQLLAVQPPPADSETKREP